MPEDRMEFSLGDLGDEIPMGEGLDSGASGLPPDYTEALADAGLDLDEAQQSALWDAIAACVRAVMTE